MKCQVACNVCLPGINIPRNVAHLHVRTLAARLGAIWARSTDYQEEVNEVAVNPKGEYLAAADDSGVVNIYNIRSRRLHKPMRNAHKVTARSYSL